MKRNDYIVIWTLSCVPTIGVCYGYELLTDGKSSSFWLALSVLWGVGLFLWCLNWVSTFLVWRVTGKELLYQHFFKLFEESKMPQRDVATDRLDEYLNKLANPDHEFKTPVTVLDRINGGTLSLVYTQEVGGFWYALRTRSTLDRVYQNYVQPYMADFPDDDARWNWLYESGPAAVLDSKERIVFSSTAT